MEIMITEKNLQRGGAHLQVRKWMCDSELLSNQKGCFWRQGETCLKRYSTGLDTFAMGAVGDYQSRDEDHISRWDLSCLSSLLLQTRHWA